MPAHRAATTTPPDPRNDSGIGRSPVNRRRFLGYLIAAPVVVAVAEIGRQSVWPESAPWGAAVANAAPLPSLPQTPEYYEFVDSYRDACRPTNALLKVEVNKDGTVSFALPRSDNGQGILTSFAMLIAEEMDIDPKHVRVTLADARPELMFNQLTGGSSSTYSLYTPVRVAAAIAKGALLDAAALQLGQERRLLTTAGLAIVDTSGKSIGFGELSSLAASPVTRPVEVVLKPREEFKVLGKPRIKDDQRDIATGKKKFAMDLQIPDALPTVICRAPDLNGFPKKGLPSNIDEVRKMPGITDVARIANGIAVRAETFGQAFDGVNALKVSWAAGTVAGKNDDDILKELRAAELPLAVPAVPGKTIEQEFVHYARNGSALETNCAIVAFKDGKAEVWAPAKSPISGQKLVSQKLGIAQNAVTFHVVPGGGSFGRRLFNDHVQEAAEAAKAIGKPVKLMWDRASDCRQGRVKPLTITRIRAVLTGNAVASFELRQTGVAVEIDEGLTDVLTSQLIKAPGGNLGVSETFWEISVLTPYNFGVNTRFLNEVEMGFNTGSTRNVYGPDTCTAREVMIDRIAEKLGRDPYEFRAEFIKTERGKKVLDRVAKEADWGKKMKSGTAQGIGFHAEYKAMMACVVELDTRPETVNRPIRMGKTGPRVTKVTFVVDPGLLLNPLGYQAQMMGGINDGIANALTAGLHLENGHFLEASWDNYYYTRQWNTPPEMNIIVLEDSESPEPAGAGEAGVAAAMSAVVCAHRRATGQEPTYTPLLQKDPLPFEPYPAGPIPPSPTNSLDFLY